MKQITIIIPCYNEEKYIRGCLHSVLNSDFPQEDMEVFVVDGGSQDQTVKIVKEFQRKYPCIRLLHNPQKIVPVAMNMGIKKSQGKHIVRLDAHADYPTDYFDQLIYWHRKLNADNVGAVVVTEVKNKNCKSNAIKAALSHSVGVGNSSFRTGISAVQEVDTVPFGCYRREVFDTYGLYDERLIRNQDIELNKRIARGGGKIYLVPDLQITYFARENFTDLAKNSYANGYWNMLTAYYTKKLSSLSLRHFVPLLFVFSLVLPVICALCFSGIVWVSVLSLVSYLTLVIIISAKLKTQATSFGALVGSFLTLHLSYGLGSLVGLLKVLTIYIKGEK